MQTALKLISTPARITSISTLRKKHMPVRTQTAQPITNPHTLSTVKSKLLSTGKYGYRNYLIFCLGINLGIRCGDLLSLKVLDIYNPATNTIKDPFYIREQKTGKVQMLSLNDTISNELLSYIQTLDTYNRPLFVSQKGHNKPISRASYSDILKDIGTSLGIEHLTTHTMRKTCLRAIYDQNKGTLTEDGFSAIDIVQMLANHSSTSTSLRYIGITDTVKMNVRKSINL